MDKLDFLDGDTPVEPTAAATTPEAAPTPEPSPEAAGQPRGPDGKFAPKAEAAPAAQAEPQAPALTPEALATPAAESVRAPDGYVPVAALQAEREKANAYKRQLEQQPPPPAPDPYEDFEAYQAWQSSQVVTERTQWSKQLAEAKHGADLVTQAQQWAFERFDTDPAFAQAAASSRDPYGFAIAEFQRHQALSLLSDPSNLAKFQAFLTGQGPAPAAAPAVVPASPQSPTPPRSLASVPNAGGAQPGAVPTGPGAAFDAVFKD
jgi:hypothetical protein